MAKGHYIDPNQFTDKFTQDSALKKFLKILLGAGAVFFVIGLIIVIAGGEPTIDHGHGHGDGHEHHDGGHGHDDHGHDHSDHGHSSADKAPVLYAQNGNPDQTDSPDGAVGEPDASPANEETSDEVVENVGEGEVAPTPDSDAAMHGESGIADKNKEDHIGHDADESIFGGEITAQGALGWETHYEEHHKPWGHASYWLTRLMLNIMQNSFYFMGIAVLGLFFIAVNYATNAGWFMALKRIPESFTRIIPIAWGLLFLVWIMEMAGLIHLHPWTNPEAVAADPLLQAKEWYLNLPFFLIRQLLIIAAWIFVDRLMRKYSTSEDAIGGTKLFRKRRQLGAIFLVIFAVSWSLSCFDWILAVDPHWFSTMFAVHMFANHFVSALCMMVIIGVYMKAKGFMPYINESHLHDLGKFIFGFSIFWTYVWFSQFMLIWYANIPEETMFFIKMIDQYPFLFAFNLVINFVFPLLGLMTNTSKRRPMALAIAAGIIFLGKYVDLFLMVSSSTLGPDRSIGFLEIGTYLLFLGLFLVLTFRALEKTNLIPKKHPYIQESLQHWI